MKVMYLIVGRSGSGKDYLADCLKTAGAKRQVITHTTRPRRNPSEHSHIFISDVEAASIPSEQKLLPTTIDGYVYFTSPEELQKGDICIIEPNGLAELLSTELPDTKYVVVSVQADRTERKAAAESRGADKALMRQMFDSRSADEKARFDDFERMISTREGQNKFKAKYPNLIDVFVHVNTYSEQKTMCFVKALLDMEKDVINNSRPRRNTGLER